MSLPSSLLNFFRRTGLTGNVMHALVYQKH
jgi:hypothetical protein